MGKEFFMPRGTTRQQYEALLKSDLTAKGWRLYLAAPEDVKRAVLAEHLKQLMTA
jgi:hypothetical protein